MGLLEDGSKSEKIYWRIMGASAAIGAIFGFLFVRDSPFSEIEIFLVGRLLSAATAAFGTTIIVTFLLVPVGIIFFALEGAQGSHKPFHKGAIFIFLILMGSAAMDLLIFQGQMVISPALYLLTTGDFGPTYWGCEDWVVEDMGEYCND